MSGTQDLAVREKQEVASKGAEKTSPGRTYLPAADIFETEEALTILMEMPGVDRAAVTISLENDVLRVQGQIDFGKYEGMEPVYTEYNVGGYARSFALSRKIDQEHIAAQMQDGVLTLTLPKAKESQPRKIQIG
jgi:HSP20 family molecular chaperone IbpA